MIGYHYTSAYNYQNIKEKGLVPYTIEKASLEPYFREGKVKGVWLWEHQLQPIDELGTVLYQLCHRARTKILRLKIEYKAGDRLFFEDIIKREGFADEKAIRYITCYHTGTLENYNIHPNNPSAHIITKRIPPSKITVDKTFELMDIVK